MSSNVSATTTKQRAADDALARLLAAEDSLATQIADAEERAQEILRQAREDAARVEAACAATIARGNATLEERYEKQLSAAIAEIARQTQSTSQRFAAATAERLDECVECVIHRLLAIDQAESGQ